MEKIHFDYELDARQLSCPLPVFTTRKSVDRLNPGEVTRVITTDRGSVSYFESLVRQTGLELLSWNERNGEFEFYIRKPRRG